MWRGSQPDKLLLQNSRMLLLQKGRTQGSLLPKEDEQEAKPTQTNPENSSDQESTKI